MDRVFADTSYWIAILNPRDELHSRAVSLAQELRTVEVVTSDLVLVEFLNSFSSGGTRLREAAAGVVVSARSSSRIQIVSCADNLLWRALESYRLASDKNWSLTDCASFVIMREYGLTSALTHDRHFEQAGFRSLLR